MNININADWKVFHRIAIALESFVADYRVVNASAIEAAKLASTVDARVGKSYYQSDRAVYEAEQEAKARAAVERGEVE